MTQGVPGEDEMTSRAGPTILERILDGREPLLDLMSEYRAAIEQEVRDDIRARLEGPVRALHRWDCSRPASEFNEPLAEIVRVLVLAAISSSSATETQGLTHREQLAYKAGELAGREAERLGVSATETQDGERPGLRELRALSDAATPGPWCVDDDGAGAFGTIFQGREWSEDAPWLFDRATDGKVADSRLAVAAVNHVRDALATPTPDDRDRAGWTPGDGPPDDYDRDREVDPAFAGVNNRPDEPGLRAARQAMEDRYHDLAWCNKDDDCHTKAEGARLAIEDFEQALGVEPFTHPEPSRGSALREHRQAVVHAEAALAATPATSDGSLDAWTVDRVFDALAKGEITEDAARDGIKALLRASDGSLDVAAKSLIRAAISDAYHEAREDGETMEFAASDGAERVLDVLEGFGIRVAARLSESPSEGKTE